MRKIPCLFRREFHERDAFTLTDEVSPECGWVLIGEGAATRKWDGTCCLIENGHLLKRYDRKFDKKTGERKQAPADWRAADEPDDVTGHWPGWLPVGDEPESRWHREALDYGASRGPVSDGNYELIGPKVNGGHEGVERHILVRHGGLEYGMSRRTLLGIRAFLAENLMEGLVFHHPNGWMCKIRRDDYGLPWGQRRDARGRWLRLDGKRHTANCLVAVGSDCDCGGGAIVS